MTDTITTFSVPTLNLNDLTKRLNRLSKKANKYGNSPIGYSIGEKYIKDTTIYIDNTPKKIKAEFVDIIVWGDAPKYGDHKFLAHVELYENENIVHNIANTNLNNRFRHMVSECDHCGYNRVRNDVYVFENQNGEQIAVGKTCLRDFAGIDNPKDITSRAQFLKEIKTHIDEEMGAFSNGTGYYDLKTVLTYTAANIRQHGWVSKANSDPDMEIISTYDRVLNDLAPNAKYRTKIEEVDNQIANDTINYFRNMEPVENNDYLNNLRVMMKTDTVMSKHLGMIVSSVNVILKEESKKAEINNAQNVSQYVGKEKERMRNVELIFVKEIFLGMNTYGETYMYQFTDNSGNQIIWFTGKKDFNIGEKYNMDFTVKCHKEYNNIKQTIITRAKIK